MKRNDPILFPCERWMEYVAVPVDAPLPPEFAEHMITCEVCREEWNQLCMVWEALALDTEEVEVPAGLKEEVMNAIFADSPKVSPVKPGRKLPNMRRISFRIAAAAAVCLLIVSAIGIRQWVKPQPANIAAGTDSANLQREWALTAFDTSMPDAKGQARLVRQGDDRIMVVSTEGLKPTNDKQAYQVWLIHEGKRDNCGTFRVDESGNGLLVYRLDEAEEGILGIGITLEPDSGGVQPRGHKVLGTSLPASNS